MQATDYSLGLSMHCHLLRVAAQRRHWRTPSSCLARMLLSVMLIHVAGCSHSTYNAASLARMPIEKAKAMKGKTIDVRGPVVHARTYPKGSFAPSVPTKGSLVQLGEDGRWGDALYFTFSGSESNGVAIESLKRGDIITVRGLVTGSYGKFAGDNAKQTEAKLEFGPCQIISR